MNSEIKKGSDTIRVNVGDDSLILTEAQKEFVERRIRDLKVDKLLKSRKPRPDPYMKAFKYYEQPRPFYVKPEFHSKFLSTVQPHIDSFDTFLNFYIKEIPKHLCPVYVDPYYEHSKHVLDPYYVSPEYLKISVANIEIGKPIRTDLDSSSVNKDLRLFPRHARISHTSYGAPLYVTLLFNNSAEKQMKSRRVLAGTIPLMVRSSRCHLRELSAEDVVALGQEEKNEPGAYFIINGNERVIRFVIQQRCNYPIAIRKERFKDRDVLFTDLAVMMRLGRSDGTSTNNILFLTEDNQCVLRILLNRQEFTCPFWVVLKALFPPMNLQTLKAKFFEGCEDLQDEIEIDNLWRDMVDNDSLVMDIDHYEDRYLSALGRFFWDACWERLKPGSTYAECGRYILNQYVMVHVESWNAKLESLLMMLRKLFAVKRNKAQVEEIDSFAFQEVVTPGTLFAAVLKDALFNALFNIRGAYQAHMRTLKSSGEDPVSAIRSETFADSAITGNLMGVAAALNGFMSTGTIKTYQLDLQQTTGWTVVADRLNMHRFVSHFRAVHRGQFFTQMKTTEVRKLMGETWGFLCPVHTPDGGPCGLLLHLARDAKPVSDPPDGSVKKVIKKLLWERGVLIDITGRVLTPPVSSRPFTFPLVVDGEPICRLPWMDFDEWVEFFRKLKRDPESPLPANLEVAAFPRDCGSFPGLFLFSYPGRLVRPVVNVESKEIEYIGPLAQPWMAIATSEEAVEEAKTLLAWQQQQVELYTNRPPESAGPTAESFKTMIRMYKEHLKSGGANSSMIKTQTAKMFDKYRSAMQCVPQDFKYLEPTSTSFLSVLASFTPFSNHNQSPRNMYQCQMAKQTMGTPYLNHPWRTDNKVYKIMFPQKCFVRTRDYAEYGFEEHSSGTNAVVAVAAYTGFDLEDAMIISKSALERGFAAGVVYKTKVIEAAPDRVRPFEKKAYVFSNRNNWGKPIDPGLDIDGLPHIGTHLKRGTPLYRTENLEDQSPESGHVHKYQDDEEAFVDKINIVYPNDSGSASNSQRLRGGQAVLCQRVIMTLRCIRNPIVGDKFASRAGQKGILSLHYPITDMPFSVSGITPDILFNPHGFPSRMTIGMIIESMAGKSAALYGRYHDASPFAMCPKQDLIPKEKRWIDQGGVSGWIKRGERYMTSEEYADYKQDMSVDYFGKLLLNKGFSYYGSEPMHSGMYGVEMKAHLFTGIIHYQRLRHMVSDKWQVRATGPIDSLTRQPVKGRKKGGGVRFGEMERDALISHGASFLLQDRLLHCSDEHQSFVCPSCGSILSACLTATNKRKLGGVAPVPLCIVCKVPCRLVNLPYVFRYICNELASMNIAIRLQLSEGDKPISVKPRH